VKRSAFAGMDTAAPIEQAAEHWITGTPVEAWGAVVLKLGGRGWSGFKGGRRGVVEAVTVRNLCAHGIYGITKTAKSRRSDHARSHDILAPCCNPAGVCPLHGGQRGEHAGCDMTRYSRRHWFLAIGVSTIAGYVDAIGFLKLGGLFVSFMSGNSTQLGVGLVGEPQVALTAARLLTSFVVGVVAGTLIAMAAGPYRKPVLLGFVSIVLALAASSGAGLSNTLATTAMTVAMGAANAIFQRDGEVSIGVTYMTGTLVKFGQHVAAALTGGPRWRWVPYLALWSGLIAGALAGALAYPRFDIAGLWIAIFVAWLLAAYAFLIGPAGPVTFLSNAGVLQVFGVNDYETADMLSKTMGQTTVRYTTTGGSEQRGWLGPTNGSSNWSQQLASHNLMDPNEIMKLQPDRMLLLMSGKDPMILRKIRYFKEREFAGMFDKA
jgi:uncharacterized membrane protein YoaK (UPF0700 family)